MILHALVGYYDRITTTGDVAEEGYGPESISYRIKLARDGAIVDVEPTLAMVGKKARPQKMRVPVVKRTSGIRSGFLWDKTAYAFGVSARSKRAAKEHAAFRAYHEKLLQGTDDEGLVAFLAFLKSWAPAHYDGLRHAEEMRDANVVFQLDGEFMDLHERSTARTIWARAQASGDAEIGLCLVTGAEAPIARIHASIRNIAAPGQPNPKLVAIDKDSTAFNSFGKLQGANAPVSERAAHAYATALNHLLSAKHGISATGQPNYTNRVQIGDATTVFFAEAKGGPEQLKQADAGEKFFRDTIEPPTDEAEATKLKYQFQAIEAGRPLAEIDPKLDPQTRFFVIGLSPNAARLSVRFFHDTTLGTLARRMGEHWRDLRVEPNFWRTKPPIRRLVSAATCRWEQREGGKGGKYESDKDLAKMQAKLAGDFARAIFAGTRYPRPLLAHVLARIRADGRIDDVRAALIKAGIARDRRLGFAMENIPVSLDINELNPGYRLGRLFAILENVQRKAITGLNATIRDKFYSSASSAPAGVFPLLLRGAQDHLAKIRKSESIGLSIWFDKRIAEIIDGLPAHAPFPAVLRLEDQSRFAVGFYHEKTGEKGSDEDSDASDETTGTVE